MAQQILGSRILGGIGAPGGRGAASFGAGVDTALNQRTSRQQMQEREQAMQLRASEEQRRQQQFEDQRRQAAQAAARAAATEAQRRAMMESIFGAGATTGAAPTAGVTVTPAARPTGFTPSVPLGFNQPGPGPGLTLPVGRPAPAPVSGGAGTPVLPGGSGADTLGGKRTFGQAPVTAPIAAPQRSFMTPESTVARAGLAGIPMGMRPSMTPVTPGGTEPQLLQVERPITIPGVGVVNYVIYDPTTQTVTGPNGEPLPPVVAQQAMEDLLVNELVTTERGVGRAELDLATARSALDVAANSGNAGAYATALDDFRAAEAAALAAQQQGPRIADLGRATEPVTSPDIFAEEGPGAGVTPPAQEGAPATGGAPPRQTRAEAETALAAATPSVAGVQLPFTSPVQLAFNQGEEAPSERYINNADLIQMDRDRLAQQAARAQQLLQYLTTTGDVGGYQQGMAIVEAQSQLAQLQTEQRYLDGMVAITSIENGNFGPLQTLLQQRPEFQGRQVEVRPYTDGTVEVYIDGQVEMDMSWGDLVDDLKVVYDTGYQEFLSQQADTLAEMRMFDFQQRSEQAAVAEREIRVAASADALARAAEEGKLQSVTDANGATVLQMRIGGNMVPVSLEEVAVQLPGQEPSVLYKVRRIDTGEVVPLDGE
jgi:hypothetical protein